MNEDELVIFKSMPIRLSDGEVMFKFVGSGKSDESAENFAARRELEKHPPQPAIARPTAPEIATMSDAPCPYNQATVDAAAKLESGVIFQTRFMNLSAAEALPFEPDDLVMATGSVSGVPVVAPFRDLAPRLESFQSICINPVVGPRFRVPTCRRNIVLAFPGISLVAQFGRALHLAGILKLNLAVYAPAKMAIEFWFSAGTAAANKKFARAAFKLGYNAGNPFNPGEMASVPGAVSWSPPPPAATAQLKSIGIERRDDRQNLVLFKREPLEKSPDLVLPKVPEPAPSGSQPEVPSLLKLPKAPENVPSSSRPHSFPDSAWRVDTRLEKLTK